MDNFRVEHDTMGEVRVPKEKYWGSQTQRSLENFKIGKENIEKGIMPLEVIRAMAIVKKSAALVNGRLDVLSNDRVKLISQVCDEILSGSLNDNFPLAVYQTGSGTQTNMNLNEVIANRGNEIAGEKLLHPNDHVNKSQSSNDTFPTAMHVAALISIRDSLIPAIDKALDTLWDLEVRYAGIIKTGRTHLQDAIPITLGQEISGWRSMLEHNEDMIERSLDGLREIPLGGTAVGTGLNAPQDFESLVAEELSDILDQSIETAENKFHSLSSKDALVYAHGALKALAANLMKIANDVRWLGSGPRCGLGEISLPANEPGSSIMPGKVNPTQCEALTMVCVRVMGNDTTIGFAASQGNFQLNVFMPVIIDSFLESLKLLSEGLNSFDEKCLKGIEPIQEKLSENLEKSLMLVTALNTHIGYENAALIAKTAFSEGITLKEAGVKLGLISEEDFDTWVNPWEMV